MLSETVVSAVWSVCMPERAMFIMALMAIAYLRPARRAGLVGNICRMATGLAAPLRHNPLIRNNFIFQADSLALADAQERRQNRRACRHSPPMGAPLGRPCLSGLGNFGRARMARRSQATP